MWAIFFYGPQDSSQFKKKNHYHSIGSMGTQNGQIDLQCNNEQKHIL